MNKITVDNLHEHKISDIVESVIEDIQFVGKHGIGIDMSTYVTSENGKVCTVCLGGAAIMGFIPDNRVHGTYMSSWDLIKHGVNEGATAEQMGRVLSMSRMFDSLRVRSYLSFSSYAHEVNNSFPEWFGHEDHPALIELNNLHKTFFGIISDKEMKELKRYIESVVRILRKYKL